MSGRDWYIRWDKESIIKALNDYKEKTGRAPTVTNLVETGMPKNLTIQSHFHIRASEFLKQLFPENRNLKKNAKPYSKFGFETEEEWLNCFAEQFKKHLCPDMCSKKYDLLRDKGTPTWSTIAKHCKMTLWKELMEAAGVKFYVRR